MKGARYSFKDTLKENTGLAVYNTGYEKCDKNKTNMQKTLDKSGAFWYHINVIKDRLSAYL